LAYSLLDRRAEQGVLPICRDHNLGTLIRSPLRSGLLTGKYTADSQFADIVRDRWNENQRAEYVRLMAQLDALRPLQNSERTLGQVALAALLTRPGVTCLIPGAKSPEQVRANAAAADLTLSDDDLRLAFP
jgi:aryl-alcohol dehydrogenase-like predicted oxidoreductase